MKATFARPFLVENSSHYQDLASPFQVIENIGFVIFPPIFSRNHLIIADSLSSKNNSYQ
jgi:hypothetical protein